MKKIALMPYPKKIQLFEQKYIINKFGYIFIDKRELYNAVKIAQKSKFATMEVVIGEYEKTPQIVFTEDNKLTLEAYKMSIGEKGIAISYASLSGAYYAMMTLNQLVNIFGYRLPFANIEDNPDFKIRGYMLDISRNKISKVETVFEMVDMLASLKMNHLELYIEGAPFSYPSFPRIWKDHATLCGEEIMQINHYCKERFLELVPTQNTFGHMGQWLKSGYDYMAECPNGFKLNDRIIPWALCLDPTDERSIQFVRDISDDLLPYFTSEKFNVCCDETLELGLGKSKQRCDEIGVGRVYLEFVMQIYDYCKSKGKTMMFWADIINSYPELIPKLPRDLVALNWGYYDGLPTENSCKLFEDNKIPYCVCPGTGVWNTQIGKTKQMLENIMQTIIHGKNHGAIGVVTTDWGDNGHLQGIAPAFAGIAYGASMSWNVNDNKDMDIANCLDKHIFLDKNGKMGQYVLDIGNYCIAESKVQENITISFAILLGKITDLKIADDMKHQDFDAVTEYIEKYEHLLYESDMQCENADLILREYAGGVKMIKLAQTFGHFYLYKKANETEKAVGLAKVIKEELEEIRREIKETWLVKNKYARLDKSLKIFTENDNGIDAYLKNNENACL